MLLTRSSLQSRPPLLVPPGAHCGCVAVGDCVPDTQDARADTRASTPRAVRSRRAAHEPGYRGNPDPTGAWLASSDAAVPAGMPLGYRTAAAELAGAAEIAPRRLHTAGTAWLHPRTGLPRRAHGCAQDRKKINPPRPDSSLRSAGLCYRHSTPSWRRPSCATPSRASWHLPVPRLHCDEQQMGHLMASPPHDATQPRWVKALGGSEKPIGGGSNHASVKVRPSP